MLVCRRWCDVARGTSSLWRAIDVGKRSSWLNLALTRSATTTVDVSFYSGLSKNHASLLRPHYWYRLRSLHLQHWSPDVLRVICSTFLVLEHLEVRGYRGTEAAANAPRTANLDITHQWFPNLKAVLLSRIIVPNDLSFYARLTRLCLEDCVCQFPFEQLVQVLADSLALEYLHLDHFIQRLYGAGDRGGYEPPYLLPSLVSLRLDNHTPMHSERFLAQIAVPPTGRF